MRAMALVLTGILMSLACAQAQWTGYLEGGALIAHHVPELAFTHDPPPEGWCASYASYAIGTPEEQNNRIDTAGQQPATWFLLAAWVEDDKQWCGCEFGLGDYPAGLFGFEAFGPCFPEEGLELPSANWPGPGEGTAIVALGTAWGGNLTPVYYFGGYAYAAPGPGIIPIAEDPATGFVGFSNCATPPEAWEAGSLGGMGVNMDGIFARPVGHARRVCCLGDSCCVLTYPECSAVGGGWVEGYDACEPLPNACETLPKGACCRGDECLLTIVEQCDELGGEWLWYFEFCDPNPCDPGPSRVCCYGDLCVLEPEPYCLRAGGAWHPEWSICDPNPCPYGVPTRETTWGRIKALYRD